MPMSLSRKTTWLLALFGFAVLLAWPIAGDDTDLWYHLAHGRTITGSGDIPSTAYFTFAGERAYADYYWLFQVLAYGVHSIGGSIGLIAMRALLFLACLAGIGWWLHGRGDARAELPLAPAAMAAVLLLLLSRARLLRPHLAGFAAIPLLMYLFERGGRRAWLAPLVAIAWTNLHGVSWPILAAICGAFILEGAVARVQAIRRGAAPPDPRLLLPAVVSLLCVFATPLGLRLTTVPFTDTALASGYILELAPIDWTQVPWITIRGLTADWATARFACVALAAIGFVGAMRERPLRIAHLALAIAGAALFSRGLRFGAEAALLWLPVMQRVAAQPLPALAPLARRAILAASCLVAGVVTLRLRDGAGAWPESRTGLPVASAKFLAAQPGGKVFHTPSRGGYLLWMLHPKHRIFADLEAPFLFTDEDVFVALHAFSNPTLFDQVVRTHHPEWLMVPVTYHSFREIVKEHPNYRPVFFDEVFVVYADALANRQIASTGEIRELDPYSAADRRTNLAAASAEIERLLAVDPESAIASVLGARLALERGDAPAAVAHARRAADAYPGDPLVLEALGDSHLATGDARAARDALRQAVGVRPLPPLRRKLALAAGAAGFTGEAYAILREDIRPFDPKTDHRDLYLLAAAAAEAGDHEHAREVLRFAALAVPADDPESVARIAALLSALDGAKQP